MHTVGGDENGHRLGRARRIRVALVCVAASLMGVACAGDPAPTTTVQRAAPDYLLPDTGPAAHAPGEGPAVAIDEAHNNYHTADGRYRSFAALLRRDGYRVQSFSEAFTEEGLAEIDLLVISNAIAASNVEAWALPNPSAFGPAEIEAVRAWVEQGGSLMLIADHMPMPGAAADLARSFGIIFHDGFAYLEDGTGAMVFRRDDNSLAEHAVMHSANGEAIQSVATFTGQAFRILPEAHGEPLMVLPAGAYIRLPSVAWEFTDATPRIAADGLAQGAVLEHGAGRVAVFGEAAAFSAQIQERDGEIVLMGMNHPDAPQNARFLLNVIAWLTG